MLNHGRYMGMCPDCMTVRENKIEPSTRPPEDSKPGSRHTSGRGHRIVIDAEQFMRAMDGIDQLVYCCDAPDLQWEGEPGTPGVRCRACGYIVAESGETVEYHLPAEPIGDRAVPIQTASESVAGQRQLF